MSSGTELITESLEEIGASSSVAPANPEAIESGRRKLRSLIQYWTTQGIDLGLTPIDAAGDEVSEPLDARQAIIDNLALVLAPSFDNGKNVVSQTLKDNARDGYERIKGIYQTVTISPKIISSTTPLGIGNSSRNGFFQRRCKGVDGTVGN